MFQLNQVACAYEQKKVFTGLDLEIRQGQYVMLMGTQNLCFEQPVVDTDL